VKAACSCAANQVKLMRGMFHLPHGDTTLLTGTPLRIGASSTIGTFRHTVTNRRITFEVFAVALSPRSLRTRGREYAWIDPAALAGIPHPSYVRKALRGWPESASDPLLFAESMRLSIAVALLAAAATVHAQSHTYAIAKAAATSPRFTPRIRMTRSMERREM